MRAIHGDLVTVDVIAARIDTDEADVSTLAGESFVEWSTTIRGSALAMASFLKPMTRQKTQWLLDGVIERAEAYNADPAKPFWIDRISVFGSFLDEAASDFGDLDLHVTLTDRPSDDLAKARRDYARASGRRFSSFLDELFWARTDALRTLKNRSGYISIHDEVITEFTDRWLNVYEREST